METRSIEFVSHRCGLGHALVAGTPRGVCWVRFTEDLARGQEEMRRAFPSARIERATSGRVVEWCRAISDYVDGRIDAAEVPIDVSGSTFAQRVWRALRQIPMGETRSYSDIARKLGDPNAARAVARAVVANPAPIAIPCHRVILKSGRMSGDAGSLSYQRAMLKREGALPSSA